MKEASERVSFHGAARFISEVTLQKLTDEKVRPMLIVESPGDHPPCPDKVVILYGLEHRFGNQAGNCSGSGLLA
jgi:hypothetical protein